MKNLWCWLTSNSGPLQSISALLSVGLAFVTIVVLVITWRAIKRQAKAAEEQAIAARALTEVATEQTKAAVDAARSAEKQSNLLSAQIEQSTAPLLVSEPDDRSGFKNYKLVNRGPGVAFQLFYWQGGLDVRSSEGFPAFFISPSTLAPGNYVYLPIPPAWEVFTVRYKGVDRGERWTIVYRDPTKPQEHVVRKGLQEFYLA